MDMNATIFFDKIRAKPFNDELSQTQVDGINAILAAFDKFAALVADPRFQAYMLATAWWETGRTMQPVAEVGQGSGKSYGAPAGPYGQRYYGRGYVQLTWLANYTKAQNGLAELGVICDLVRDPDQALQPAMAAQIMILGMVQGWFTGLRLAEYFNETAGLWVPARRIINAQDHAIEIAQAGLDFDAALIAAAA
jgi:hypothetical protein